MKNRRFPYGYEMQNGQIVICRAEAKTVKYIFSEYIKGSNLSKISEFLTNCKTEYLPGKYAWNKSRVKRIIEDKRYLGDDTYSTIIDSDTFRKANNEKSNRRTNMTPVVCAENKPLVRSVICGKCGEKLFHVTDNTQKHHEKWYCKSKSCKYGIPMTISELEKEITSIFNRLIANPTLAEHTDTEISAEPSLEITKMENEIERKLEALDFNKSELQDMILLCASKKYDDYKSVRHITDRLKADFEQSSPLSSYSPELFDRTVATVILNSDKAVSLKLKNNTIIGKEPQSYDKPSTDRDQNGQSDTAETRIFR